ncbi:MAG: O-antigen ligase family protein [Phototrophicaceae bacterium]
MRNLLIVMIAFLAMVGGFVGVKGIENEQSYELRGYVDPTTTAQLPYLPHSNRLGVQVELTQYSNAELPIQLDNIQKTGIRWVRQFIRWDLIESTMGNPQWETYDAIFNALNNHPEITPIVVFYGTPQWAQAPDSLADSSLTPPVPQYFADFIGEFVTRYGRYIRYYQVWHEPNLQSSWGNRPPSVAQYVDLLSTGYSTIKSLDGDAVVGMATLAPTTEQGPSNISDWRYLEEIYQLGAGQYFDAVGGMAYGFDSSPLDRNVDEQTLNFSRFIGLRELMLKHGDAKKAIWITDWGWNSLPVNWEGSPSIWGNVSEENQSRYTLQGIDRIEREMPYVAFATLNSWQPDAPIDDPRWGFALLKHHDIRSDMLHALEDREIRILPQNGLYHPISEFAQYSGVWTFGTLGADIGWVGDSHASFQFKGESIALLLREGDYVGYLYPSVDGVPPTDLPTDTQGQPYILLTDPILQTNLNPTVVASGLNPSETHTLQIATDRGWDRWALAGYSVSSGDLNAPYERLKQIGWFTTLVAFLSTLILARTVPWRRLLIRLDHRIASLSEFTTFVVGIFTSLILMVALFTLTIDGQLNFLKRTHVSLGLALLTTGILYLEPSVLWVVICAIILWIIFFYHPEQSIYLIMLWAPFFLYPVQLYLYAFPMSELLLLIAFSAWLSRYTVRFMQRYITGGSSLKVAFELKAIDWLIIGWAGLGILAWLNSEYRSVATTNFRTMVIEPLLFYLLLRTTLTTHRKVSLLIWSLVASAILASSFSLAMFILGEGIITAEGATKRLAGIYGSPNNLALYLERILPFVVFYGVLASQRAVRALMGFFTLLFAGLIALTQSVGAIILGIPSMALFGLGIHYRKKSFIPIVVLLILIVGGIFSLAQFPRFTKILDLNEGTSFFRLRLWQSSVQIMKDHPLFGLGLDQFLYAYRGVYILPDAWQEPNLSHPHNIIFDFGLRFGIGGVIYLMLLQVIYWKQFIRVNRLAVHLLPNERAWLLGGACAMVGLVFHGLVDNSVFVNDLVLIFMVILYLPFSETFQDSIK